jgi:AraC-like DNA-binding protein
MAELEQLLCDFENAFNCKITVHDLAHIFQNADKKNLIGPRRDSHRQTFPQCAEESRTYCLDHCMHQLNRKIDNIHAGSFIKRCHRGIIEVVVPLYVMQGHVATLFAGIWRSRNKKDITGGMEPADPALIDTLRRVLPVFGYGLINKAEFIRSGGVRDFSRKASIQQFIAMNFRKNVSLKDLSGKIGLSESRACHLVKEIFGKTFGELMTDERLERARISLIGTDYRMNEIADFSGFGSAEHFSRTFSKHCGITPGEYRRKFKRNI